MVTSKYVIDIKKEKAFLKSGGSVLPGQLKNAFFHYIPQYKKRQAESLDLPAKFYRLNL